MRLHSLVLLLETRSVENSKLKMDFSTIKNHHNTKSIIMLKMVVWSSQLQALLLTTSHQGQAESLNAQVLFTLGV